MTVFSEFKSFSPLVLVGCGNMGQALVRGWLSAGLKPEGLVIIDPQLDPKHVPEFANATLVAHAADLPHDLSARLLLLAVKPQVINAVMRAKKPLVGDKTLVVSVAAGVTLAQLRKGLGEKASLVRAMPNTPAAIGAGVTGLCASADVSDTDCGLADAVMLTAGPTVWVNDESLMDTVTATSGSGPAYVFHMVEALAAAAEANGLPAPEAMVLARQTIIGAGKLLEADAHIPAATLRERVTSPGGTTAAALDVLMQSGELTDLMTRAVAAAKKRGEELAG